MATPEEEKKKVEQSAGSAPPATPAAPVTPATPAVAETPALEQKENDGEGVKADPAKAKPSDIMHKRVRVSDGNTNHDPVPQILSNGDILLPPERGKGVAQLRMQLDDNKVAPPPPAPAPEEKKEFAYSDLFEPEEETEEERKKREKLENNRKLWAMLGDGISALANIAGTASGARSVLDGSEGLSARTAALLEKETEAREKRFAGNKARNVALRQKLREEELAKYKAETERQNSESRQKLNDASIANKNANTALADARTELLEVQKRNAELEAEYKVPKLISEINRNNRIGAKVSGGYNRSTKKYNLHVGDRVYSFGSPQEYNATVYQLCAQAGIQTTQLLETTGGDVREVQVPVGQLAGQLANGAPASTPVAPKSSTQADKPAPPKVKVTSVDTLYLALKGANPRMPMTIEQVRAACMNPTELTNIYDTAKKWGVEVASTREGFASQMGLKLQTKNQAKPKQSAQPNKQQGKSQPKGQQQGQPNRNAQGQIDLGIQWQ